jgi:two-component system sensor histidine kinase RstB
VSIAWGLLAVVSAVAGGLGVWGWQRHRAAEAAEGRIRGLIEAREQLLLAVAHELRTPLMRLRFAAELLVDEERSKERARQGERVQRDIDELDALVEDLLSWGRLEAEAVRTTERVDLPAELERQVDRASRSRKGVDAQVTQVDVAAIEADRRLLRRALGNLVSNAVRYGEGRLRLAVVVDADTVRLRVDDDGPGIPEDWRDRVMEPFVRIDASRSAEFGGSGLGLALVRRIAEAHQGRLELGTAPELGGLRADVVLPRQAVTLTDGS